MYVGSLAATRSSQECQRSATLGHGLRSLAARAAARGAVYGVPHSAGHVFGSWLLCKAAREGLPFRSLPPSFFSFIDTMYLGSLAATRSSQGGLRSDALGRRGFPSLAARAAARGAVYSMPRSAGVVFSAWLLYDAARDGLPFLSLLQSFFSLIYTNFVLRLSGCYAKQPGGSAVLRARRVRFSPCGCLRGSQGGLSTVCRARWAWFSVPGCFAKQLGGSTVSRVRRAWSFSFFVINVHR